MYGLTVAPAQPIPPSIVTAICKVMASIEAVKKSHKNQHGGYMFASTDDIYAELIRRQAEAGLVIMCLEETPPEITRVERDGKTSQWAKFCFSFVLATTEATWTDPRSRRTLMVQVTGPQTFQAAQSFASKAFTKALYLLPTGDMDLDSSAQADTEEEQIALNGAGNGKKRKSSSAAKKDGSVEVFNELRGKIAKCDDADLLVQFRAAVADAWDSMPNRWNEILEHEYTDRLADLQEARGY
jgi:hypothetical protein